MHSNQNLAVRKTQNNKLNVFLLDLRSNRPNEFSIAKEGSHVIRARPNSRKHSAQ